MNQLLQTKELDTLLESEPDSVIWTQKVAQNKSFSSIIIQVVVFAIVIFFYFSSSENPSKDLFEIDTLILGIVMICSLLFDLAKTYILATLIYSIQPSYISFEWGFLKKKKVDIPFNDITAIELVNYDDKDTSTIFFGTTKKYDVKKLDFDNEDTRAHITFENIKNGQKVYDLLKFLQNRAN